MPAFALLVEKLPLPVRPTGVADRICVPAVNPVPRSGLNVGAPLA